MNTKARKLYMQHPMAAAQLSALKLAYEQRQSNSETPYSLEEFFAKQDVNGEGKLRIEDFNAAWSAGGVPLGPNNLALMRGAYGEPGRKMRYGEALEDLARMGHTDAVNKTMTARMGKSTAKFCGYSTMEDLEDAQVTFDTRSDLVPGTRRPSSAMSSQLKTLASNATKTESRYPKPRSAAASMTASRLEMGNSFALQASFEEFDPEGSGRCTLDAFLTCCARAGVSMPPGELDALRRAGTLRRSFKGSPELVDYGELVAHMGSLLGSK